MNLFIFRLKNERQGWIVGKTYAVGMRALAVMVAGFLSGCAFEPATQEYSVNAVRAVESAKVTPDHGLLVFRTSGFKLWENQDAEFIVNGEPMAWFKAGGARYLPLERGINTVVVREPDHFLKCELTFDFQPESQQFIEIYERFDPGALMISFIFADLQSRLSYDPHPGSNCVGVYGLSMGELTPNMVADINKEYSFQVVKR